MPPLSLKRPSLHCDAQCPYPQESMSFKSMTLKKAYSVPKHTSAICVQSFDDSLNSAIHITYRISLRSSSLREPRYPLLRVLNCLDFSSPIEIGSESSHNNNKTEGFSCCRGLKVETSKHRKHAAPSQRNSKLFAKRTNKTIRKGWYGFTIMILPQVHLRKPCYDFYFL